MPGRRTPKVEALVVNAIRRLQDVQGSRSREISNYISQEYNVPSEETRRQVQLALRRGLSYGILKRSKGGYYSCNRDYLGQLSLGNGTGDGVMEPCPAQPWRFGIRKKRRAKRARQKRAREAREKREKERRRRERSRKYRRTSRARRRGRRPSRRRRRRPSGRRSRRRRRRVGRSRRSRGRSQGRPRTRADLGEIEMEAMFPEPKRNDADRKDENPHKSETSILSEYSDERHSQNSPQNSQS
ncbi:uncharacterized protein LOC143900973 [Temnothorax americanus]|uniref:uncharacterized protein LOC143900973 n=1 Tax=Temnothorax americanus TaxID=1964332 RepID=UPI004069460E